MTKFINNRIEKMAPSATLALNARAAEMKAAGISVVNLSGGDPDFKTPKPICDEAYKWMLEGLTHYVPGKGHIDLRKAVSEKFKNENGIELSPDEILITPGGKMALYLAINALMADGDEVLIPTPAWVSYEPMCVAAGAKPEFVHLDAKNKYKLTLDKLERHYTEKTRMLIINYPNNPTGRVLEEDEADAIEQFLIAHENVLLLSDEMYEKLVFDGRKHISLGARKTIADRVITENGFSKCSAMTGWRLGYIGAKAELIAPMAKLYTQTASCVPGFIQKAGVVALGCTEETEYMRQRYEARRDMFIGELNKIKGVEAMVPEGAFYAWVKFDTELTSAEFAEELLVKGGVCGVPASAFGENKYPYLRFSMASSDEDLAEAAKRIKAFFK